MYIHEIGNEELVLEELDSVLNNASYHSSSSGSKSNSSGEVKFYLTLILTFH